MADYAVLYTHSKTFTDLLTSTIEAGKTAVSNAFVRDCVNANTFLDPEQYELRIKASGKSKKRVAVQSSSSDVEELSASEHRKSSQTRGRQEGRKRVKQEREGQSSMNQPAVKFEPDIGALERLRVPSPTPPPAHTRQATSRGYKYPDIERDYALRYIKVLLERDHLMSSQAMADRLFRKVSRHALLPPLVLICSHHSCLTIQWDLGGPMLPALSGMTLISSGRKQPSLIEKLCNESIRRS